MTHTAETQLAAARDLNRYGVTAQRKPRRWKQCGHLATRGNRKHDLCYECYLVLFLKGKVPAETECNS